MNGPDWIDKLECLAVRFAGLGIGPDLSALTLAQAWGLYLFLKQLAEAAE